MENKRDAPALSCEVVDASLSRDVFATMESSPNRHSFEEDKGGSSRWSLMPKRNALLVAVLCSVCSLCPLLYSQANGSLSGTVADKTGSVISGATVKITSQGTGVTRAVTTDDSGHYVAPFLPVAIYTIRVA